MAAEQLPDGVREFTDHLRGLLARLDRYAGWCLVFWQRDPEGMRACLEGREPPPWDVVESLLQDLAAAHGPSAAEAERSRARLLHAEATAAFDARPGARQTLSDRLDVMLREQRYAADRRADLTRRLAAAATHAEAEALGNDLAWAEDDHRRATARCAELTARMTALDERTQGPGPLHTQVRWAARPTAETPKAPGSQGLHTTPTRQGDAPSPTHRHAGTGPHPGPDGRGVTQSPGPAPAPGAPQAGPAREKHGLSPAPDHWHATDDGPAPVTQGRGPARTPGGPQAGLAREESPPAPVPDQWNGDSAPTSAPDGRGAAPAPGAPQAGPVRRGHGPAPDRLAGGGPHSARDGRGPAVAREGAPAPVADQWNGGSVPTSAPDGRGAAQASGASQTGPFRQGHGPAPAHRPVGGSPRPVGDGRGSAPAPGAPQAGPGRDEAAHLHGRSPAPGSRRPVPETPAATGRHPLTAAESHPSSHSHPPPPDPVPPELRAAQQHVPAPAPAEEARPAPARKRRRGGARFAGVEDGGAAPLVAPAAAVPELPVAATAARGARFAGAAAETETEERPQEGQAGAEDLREVAHLVRALTRLRREGRSGDAHVLLNEAAYWPAVRFPLLAGEMERAGLAADWATLLWEAAATLPAERLVAAADALGAGGRAEDGEQILRQGVVRPAAEIGHAALALADGTRHRELRALLDACVRMRTPQDAARTAAPDPGRLVPLLLTAARGVSEERHWDVLHALRVAGLAA
ncbi:hypothetical protein [Streptomyces althioticus]|uniref:hypothetical protein n=1 Tax=Streptomyces althioticus TaxID=83380 RepID=UPI003873585C|nr:hypothetical protein OG872_05775 [Streptomyces althioticus]